SRRRFAAAVDRLHALPLLAAAAQHVELLLSRRDQLLPTAVVDVDPLERGSANARPLERPRDALEPSAGPLAEQLRGFPEAIGEHVEQPGAVGVARRRRPA